MTKIIGLTGGIGSGKTTIAHYFKSLGIAVYIADDEAKKLLENAEIKKEIRKVFGDLVFENNAIVREKLGTVVFRDPEKLKSLNNIIHPVLKKHFEKWVSDHKNDPIVIKEAAILFESGSDQDCYKVITVVAPTEMRIQRVISRDNISREAVTDRIKNQWTDEMRKSKSDFVIENINKIEAKQQVNKILKILINP